MWAAHSLHQILQTFLFATSRIRAESGAKSKFENAKPFSAFPSHPMAQQFGSSTICNVQCSRPSTLKLAHAKSRRKVVMASFFTHWLKYLEYFLRMEKAKGQLLKELSPFFIPTQYILWLWVPMSPIYLVITKTKIASVFLLGKWAWPVTWWLDKLIKKGCFEEYSESLLRQLSVFLQIWWM